MTATIASLYAFLTLTLYVRGLMIRRLLSFLVDCFRIMHLFHGCSNVRRSCRSLLGRHEGRSKSHSPHAFGYPRIPSYQLHTGHRRLHHRICINIWDLFLDRSRTLNRLPRICSRSRWAVLCFHQAPRARYTTRSFPASISSLSGMTGLVLVGSFCISRYLRAFAIPFCHHFDMLTTSTMSNASTSPAAANAR